MWDAFVKTSLNATFLFERDYMDYHSDRFTDHSLLFFDEKNRLCAVLPANQKDNVLYSHSGLTYGSLLVDLKTDSANVLACFDALMEYLGKQGLSELVYKEIPFIYHQQPTQEDQYALWLHKAELHSCALSSVIDLRSNEVIFDRNRTRGRRKAFRAGCQISETGDLSQFWPIVETTLRDKYHVSPVHSLSEISLLHSRFPENIRCFVVQVEGVVHGGVVMYEAGPVAHSQYAHASAYGKKHGVMDFLYLHLIDYYREERPEVRYFDFGISTEQGGAYLNSNLISYKEDFGARGVVYRTFNIKVGR